MIYCYSYFARIAGDKDKSVHGYYEREGAINTAERWDEFVDGMRAMEPNFVLIGLSYLGTREEGVDAPPASG